MIRIVPTQYTERLEIPAAPDERVSLRDELATERAISARFLTDRDAAIVESARLRAELTTEKAKFQRLLDTHESSTGTTRQHVYLSSYLGDYTSAFLDSKTCCQRAALLGCIRATTKMVWDSGAEMTYEMTMKVIRTMMAEHGFVFREPGEGETGWRGYATMVPDVDALEQLDRWLGLIERIWLPGCGISLSWLGC